MSSLAAGLAIGIVGDAGVRANAQQPRLFAGRRSGSRAPLARGTVRPAGGARAGGSWVV